MKPKKRVALLGYGAIGVSISAMWTPSSVLNDDYALTAICCRPDHVQAAQSQWDGAPTQVVTTVASMLDTRPDIVIEAAGQKAVFQHGQDVLKSGATLILLSVGALADQDFHRATQMAARLGGGRVLLPAGALGGFDALKALVNAGRTEVTYTSRKPPKAWLGTPAENHCDLRNLHRSVTFFHGDAAHAALNYPKNANLAAMVALAGVGFQATQFALIADPFIDDNIGQLEAWGEGGRLSVTISGASHPENPKSSKIVGASVVAALKNESSTLQFC
jgi:aspartate dehydrogenase